MTTTCKAGAQSRGLLGLAGLVFAALASAAPVVPDRNAAGLPAIDRGAIAARYGRTPLSFEPNQGQAPKGIQYLSRAPGYLLGLDATGARLVLTGPPGRQPAAIKLGLVGASSRTALRPEQLQGGTSNYFIGDDPVQHRTNIPNYGAVRYEKVYPGIDWLVYGNPQQLEYDLVVAPHASPKSIRVAVGGAETLRLDAGGDLLITTQGRTLRQQKPVAYQLDAKGRREPVAAHYELDAKRRQLAFAVGAYDRSRSLIIDPVLTYSTFLGHSPTADSQAYAIAVDASGSAYIAGETFSADFLATASPPPSALQGTYGGRGDAFVMKLSASGAERLYATYLGGSKGDSAGAIAIDAAGNAYVGGSTYSGNFPIATSPSSTALQRKLADLHGLTDGFLVKLNPTGTARLYATYMGGENGDEITGIAVDADGNAYVTGYTYSTDFPLATDPPTTPLQASLAGAPDAFVVKVNAAGTKRLYATLLGGSSAESGYAIAVDGSGAAYVAGYTSSADFPFFGALGAQQRFAGVTDGFLVKLAPGGDRAIYGTLVGGSNYDIIYGVAVDPSGRAIVTGTTSSADLPLSTVPATAPLQPVFGGASDAFLVRMDARGLHRTLATYIGGSGSESAKGVAIDAAGDLHIAGETGSDDFPLATTPPSTPIQASRHGPLDAFYLKLNAEGSARLVATYLGGGGINYVKGVAADPPGNGYLIGSTYSSDFPSVGPAQGAPPTAGYVAAYVAKIGDAAPLPALSIDDVQVTEGDSGSRQARFTVSLSPASAGTVTVNYATADGTATAGSDYDAASGTVTFAPGQTAATIAVNVLGDTRVEPDETFSVKLANASGAPIADGTGIGTIVNDDVAAGEPTVSIENAGNVIEGNAGTTPAKFRIRLSAPSAKTVYVGFYTSDGTATAGSDYETKLTVVGFDPGQTSKSVTVNVIGDTAVEPNEVFYGRIRGAIGAHIGTDRATATIVNDD